MTQRSEQGFTTSAEYAHPSDIYDLDSNAGPYRGPSEEATILNISRVNNEISVTKQLLQMKIILNIKFQDVNYYLKIIQ